MIWRRLELPPKLNGIHNMFHICYLRKWLGDNVDHVLFYELWIDDNKCLIVETTKFINRKTKKLSINLMSYTYILSRMLSKLELTWQFTKRFHI